MKDETAVTRRKFIKHAAKFGLALTTAGCASTTLLESGQAKPGADRSSPQSIVSSNASFQYIVVGAGAGGGPLAVRLAKRGYDVLLLDAGGDHFPQSSVIPAYHARSTEDPEISWDYFVKHRDEVESLNIQGMESMKDQSNIWYPRASGIGGCTTHNAMVAMYPHPQDWENIYAQARNAGERYSASWHPQNMRELFENRVERKDYSWGDSSGWHHLELNSIWPGIRDANLRSTLIEAAAAVDHGSIFDTLRDVNSRRNLDQEGFFMIPKSTRDGSRYSVHNYVMENRGRSGSGGNLTVLPHALVKKIRFKRDADNSIRATGVEVALGKSLYRAHRQSAGTNYQSRFFSATSEIILSAGAFNTPQLLMLSGIGPRQHFESSAWKATRDGKEWLQLEGVGRNLQDRYEVSVVSRYKEDFSFVADCKFKSDAQLDPCLGAWQDPAGRDNSIYASNGVVGGLKFRSKAHKKTGDPQDLILFGVPGDFRGYYPGYSNRTFGPNGRSRNLFSWAILKGYSNNRSGQIKLKSPDFRDTPDIHFNYFGEGKEQDLDALHEAIQLVRRTNAKLGEKIEKEIFPGKKVAAKQDLKLWIEREAWGHHASCSAKMGHKSDHKAVVDYNFKVHGTQNLRIVDASVFPEIPGLFIALPIYIIAERAADIIDMEYGRSQVG
jgi:choline dehydrogenase